jgi:glycosyltransferase involved in cell wall biosynthesis
MPADRRTTTPTVSVVIPTYNRHELLRRTLETLCAQRFDTDAMEVVVSDDGSADATESVARSFADRLRLHYVFQPDEGARIAATRNNGARIATAPVLLFLDTGVLAGPDLVSAHLAAHASSRPDAPGPAVLGYAYGYNPFDRRPPLTGVADLLAEHPPEHVRDLLGHEDRFWDMRHHDFARLDFDLARMHTPWTLLWTMNASIRAADFNAVGGFDEGFRSWGGEDVDLGFRLAAHGVPFVVSREAWAIEWPHERDLAANRASNQRNVGRLFEKAPSLLTELYSTIYSQRIQAPLEYEYLALLAWGEKSRTADPAPRWDTQEGLAQAGRRVAVFGAGTTPAPPDAAWTLFDFDDELLRQRADPAGCTALNRLGVSTGHPDGAFDTVVVTTRLTGLWARWGREIKQEAARLAPDVRVLFPEE